MGRLLVREHGQSDGNPRQSVRGSTDNDPPQTPRPVHHHCGKSQDESHLCRRESKSFCA